MSDTLSPVELAKLFTEYAETEKRLNELRAQIETVVLALGESQKIAGVKATYYQPSLETDYEAAALSANPPPEIIASHSTQRVSVSWKAVAEHCFVDLAPYQTEKPARVVVK